MGEFCPIALLTNMNTVMGLVLVEPGLPVIPGSESERAASCRPMSLRENNTAVPDADTGGPATHRDVRQFVGCKPRPRYPGTGSQVYVNPRHKLLPSSSV